MTYVYRKEKNTKLSRHILYEHVNEAPLSTEHDFRGQMYYRYRQCITPPLSESGIMGLHDERVDELGMVSTYAYRCNRCNYYWLPRDYDPAYQNIMKCAAYEMVDQYIVTSDNAINKMSIR
jgi:hypothetical protein